MTIQTFPRLEHKGCPIYIRQFLHNFEYLLVYKGEIYTASMEVTPRKDKFGDERDYSKQEIDGSVKVMFAMAVSTINEILKKSKSDVKEKKNGKSKSS